MRAYGYFSEGAAGGLTVAQQNKAFLDYCKREGLTASDTFVEPAPPNGRAPGFRQLIGRVRTGDLKDCLVVLPSVAALGVERTEALFRFLQLESTGVRITSIEDGALDSETQLTAWLRADDGESLGDRVRAAMRRKAVKGEVLGRPPYGYKVGSRRRLELIPEEAVVVRYIFRLYLNERLGIRLIARRLNEEGLKTRRSGNWSMVSIRDILRNRAYLGTYARFGVRVPGSHPQLVSAEDFRKVQDRLNTRRTSFAPRVASQFLLSGLARCGYCGNKLIGVSRKQSWTRRDGESRSNSYRYYQCESRTNQSVCGYHTRRAAALEAEVRSALVVALAEAAQQPQLPPRALAAAGAGDLRRLQSRARAVSRRFEGYLTAVARGRLSKDRLHDLALTAAGERLAVDDALERAERQQAGGSADEAATPAREGRIERLLADWEHLPFGELQSAVRDVVAGIVVTDDDVRLTLG
ncbi:MAG: recombinase family protein [Dehalococcoidia bacterium]|nr:recombinase family protein [Dehalococcoidia bacterium]